MTVRVDPRGGPRPLRRGRASRRRPAAAARAMPSPSAPACTRRWSWRSCPEAAVLASLGCGNPIAVAELHEGERVLDLGSGGGIDVLLSAQAASGPTGRAIGLDMTDEMLALAQRNAAEAGATNVEFLKGTIEAIPLPADSVDVVISNCVINLAADKPAVFREIARVLRPGGRMGVTDIVAEDRLTPAERAERGSYTGCIAGALSFSEFRAGLEAVGLTDVSPDPDPRRRRRHGQRDRQGDEAGRRAPAHRPDRRAATCRSPPTGAVAGVAAADAHPARGYPPTSRRSRRCSRPPGCRSTGPPTRSRCGVVARDGDAVVAAAALERYGDAALLRSVVVAPDRRRPGVGRGIVAAAESLARDEGVRDLYLLTETAVDWFPRLGYEPVDRSGGRGGRRRVRRVHDRVPRYGRPDVAPARVNRHS